MDSVTDICKYHFLCFVTIIQVKVISGHQVKKVKQTKNSWFRAAIHVFRSDFSQRTRKMTLKHFLKRQNWSKNRIRKITGKSRNDVKSACFLHVLCYISAIFEDIDLKLCTHVHSLWHMLRFENFDLGGNCFEKKKKTFFFNFQNFQNFENPREQFRSPTNSTSFHISQLIVALKLQ